MSKTSLCMLLVLLTQVTITLAQSSCKTYTFTSSSNNNNTNFTTCIDLPVLSSYLHYNYYPATATLEIAYRHTGIPSATSRWVAWAINPTGRSMMGAQALVAYRKPDGTVMAFTSPIASYTTDLAKGDLSFKVSNLWAVSQNDEIIIFATINVPNNATVLNQLWQDGPLSRSEKAQIHSTSGPNVQSIGTLDILSGVATASHSSSSPGHSIRNVHGLLCALSWGTMMAIGAIIARYLRRFPSADPAWFYIHVGCQLTAYAIGVIGWGMGIKLAYDSHPGVRNSAHGNIGITLFVLGTIQMFALMLRPAKDHQYRCYWNRYHQIMGATVIILGVTNVLLGFRILKPSDVWKRLYYWIMTLVVVIDVVLELLMASFKKTNLGEDGSNQDQALNTTYHTRP